VKHGAGPVPGLLPWQVLFLGAACGAWAVHGLASGLMAALLVLACGLLAGRSLPRPLWYLAAVLAGFLYAWARLPAEPNLPAWIDERPSGALTGRVDSVDDKPGGRLEVILSGVSFHFTNGRQESLPGLLSWTWQDPAFRPSPGDTVTLKARPHAVGGFDNPGGADWGFRQRIRGIFLRAFTVGPKAVDRTEAEPPGPVEAWRLGLSRAILDGASGGSPGGMVLGLVTGDRFSIDRADLDRVRRASLSHLLAVSGMNLAAVVAMGWVLAWLAGLVRPGIYLRIPRPKLAVLMSVPLVAGYLWLGRFEPSLTRAALMFAAWGVLILLGRANVLLDGLFFALAAMFLASPLCVFDVGLELSACAVAGIALLLPLAQPVIRSIRAPGAWRLAAVVIPGWLAVTLAAQLAVFPIQVGVFGEASPHLYLNLLWVPVVEWAAQPLAYLGALTVTWLPSVGEPLLYLSGRVCALMLQSLEAMDGRGWLSVSPVQRPWPPEVLGWYLLFFSLPWLWSMPGKRRLALLALCAALLGGPSLYRAWDQGRDRVRLTMLDVGQGQALLIEAKGGERWLVDAGGPSSESFDPGRSVLAPALTWGRPPKLGGMVMSHPDQDHISGMPYLLEHFRLGFAAGNGQPVHGEAFADALRESGLTLVAWKAGERIELSDGLSLETLSPPGGSGLTGNDASLVLRLVWRGRGLAVLPGDAGREVLNALAASGTAVKADALAVSHHGSRTGLSPEFYARCGMKWALVSCGRGNRYGFPVPEVVRALEASGAAVLQTAYRGAITLEWSSPDAPPTITAMRP